MSKRPRQSVLDCPAFVLGNSPYLPPDLSCLNNKFTVGVNRILRTGFTPTVLLWVDGNIYSRGGKITEDGEAIDACGALLVCDKSVAHRQYHHGLEMRPGSGEITQPDDPKLLWCNGNTGTCAARWVFALGCPRAYLVGMEAEYKEGISDFYGDNPWHRRTGDETTLMLMEKELRRLLRDFSGQVFRIARQETLNKTAAGTPDVNQVEAKAAVLDLVS